MNQLITRLSPVAAAAVCAMLTGCDGPVHALGGGASTKPSVTILLSNQAADSSAGGETSAAGNVAISGYGTFKGRVVVSGSPPSLPPLLAQGAPTKDAVCAQNAVPDESIVAGPGGGLANVFIYLKKVPGGEIPPPPTDPVVLDQKGCRFVPHAAIVRVGQPMMLMNADPVSHNTAFSPLNSAGFNSTISPNDRTGTEYKYAKPEAVPVRARCDIHAWMGSYHLPLNHPWGAVTAEDGSFEIKGVPGTTVEFVVWQEKIGYVNRSLKVKIEPDQTVEQEITVDASKLAK